MNQIMDNDSNLEDVLKIEENLISIEEIDKIANNKNIRKDYESKFKNNLYSTILMSLTHNVYSDDRALELWNGIESHLMQINKILHRNIGVAVASLDYLSNIINLLSEPKIIEEDKSSFIAEAATVDDLTRLYVRDVFNIILKKEFDETNRNNKSLCMLMIDIDDFKEVNDTYGHQTGDKVLKKIGSTLNSVVRGMDLAARYGGEELVIIMPNIGVDSACQAADRIRKKIEKLKFDGFNVTVSIGVSEADKKNITTPAALIKKADLALYSAKKSGKNRVMK